MRRCVSCAGNSKFRILHLEQGGGVAAKEPDRGRAKNGEKIRLESPGVVPGRNLGGQLVVSKGQKGTCWYWLGDSYDAPVERVAFVHHLNIILTVTVSVEGRNLSNGFLTVTFYSEYKVAMSDLASAKQFQFIGGNLSLDFCNTMGGKRGVETRDHLGSCFVYLAWAFQAGILDRNRAQKCIAEAEKDPQKGEEVLERARELREALFRIFAGVIEGESPRRADLAMLNAELGSALGRLQLTRSGGGGNGFAWEWRQAQEGLEQPLGPIAHEAAKLLTDEHELEHLTMCNGQGCGWLFLDSSKNHSRRWCDMRDCGNRAKIRRHRAKRAKGRAQD
jgi:predicted RNA-binding Zn ribbon-like protein